MKLHIAACDDDAMFLERLQTALMQVAGAHRFSVALRKFSSGVALLQDFEQNGARFDMIFLDIDMPQENGKHVAERLRALDRFFVLVFISSLAEEVFQIFEYNTAYFLPKTKFDTNFEPMLLHLYAQFEQRAQDSMQYDVRDEKGRKQLMRFSVRDILYIESVKRDILLHTQSTSFRVMGGGFEQIKHDLDAYGFVETHRTCTVNARYIESVEAESVLLENGSSLPLSRRRRQDVFAAMARVLEGSLR